jgi:hypothetical protein
VLKQSNDIRAVEERPYGKVTTLADCYLKQTGYILNMYPGLQDLTVRLQSAFLKVTRLVEAAPLNDDQMNELEEHVKTFWKLALEISESPTCRRFEA